MSEIIYYLIEDGKGVVDSSTCFKTMLDSMINEILHADPDLGDARDVFYITDSRDRKYRYNGDFYDN